jgi:hypothetical protein
MTKILTVRLAPDEMELCDAWARELGVTRTDFVRSRLFDSAAKPSSRKEKRFSSTDLIGSLAVGRGSTNDCVRAAMGNKKAR